MLGSYNHVVKWKLLSHLISIYAAEHMDMDNNYLEHYLRVRPIF